MTAVLHPLAVDALRLYLKWRGMLNDRNGPLFLTYKRKPYSTRGREQGWSGSNKTAFNKMKERSIRDLLRGSVLARRARDIETAVALKADARLVRQVTQHWLRHWLATNAMAMKIPDMMIMDQQGWRDQRSRRRYQQDNTAARAGMLAGIPLAVTIAKPLVSVSILDALSGTPRSSTVASTDPWKHHLKH